MGYFYGTEMGEEMSKKIEYRAWDKEEGFAYSADMGLSGFFDLCEMSDFIEQYTGLKDKNGEKIFEGDLVYIQYNQNKEEADGIVKMIDGCWMLDFQHLPEHRRPYDPYQQITRRFDYLKMFTMSIQRTAQIVGNIHEQLEAL